MAYGHAERNLAVLRQLEAETRQLLESLDQPDPEQSAWLQEAALVHGREEKPRAVRQDQVLLSERPVVARSRDRAVARQTRALARVFTDAMGRPRTGAWISQRDPAFPP